MNIWKYNLFLNQPKLAIPAGALFLSCHVQYNEIALWFWIPDPDQPKVDRTFSIQPTGDVDTDPEDVFLGTVLLAGGSLVFHIFETT